MGERRKFFTYLFTALFFLLVSVAVASTPASAQTVNVHGCVKRGVEMGCLIITDLKTNKTYNIGLASPRPDPASKVAIRLKGQISDSVSFCQQGQMLSQITWSYTKTPCNGAK